MADGLGLFLTFVAAAALTVATVPAAIAIAGRTGFLDHPAGYKAHAAPTPYLGGLAVLVAWLAAALAFDGGHGYGSLLVGTVGLAAVGTIDDRHNLSPLLRVALEVAAAWLLWDAGIHWSVFGAGALDFALSAFWVVAIVNALNLMDNLDGAAASVGGVCSLGVGVLAQVGGDRALAVLAFGLAAALLGFLRHNLARPSRIFLGDGGSMAIGFFLAAGLMAAPTGGLRGGRAAARRRGPRRAAGLRHDPGRLLSPPPWSAAPLRRHRPHHPPPGGPPQDPARGGRGPGARPGAALRPGDRGEPARRQRRDRPRLRLPGRDGGDDRGDRGDTMGARLRKVLSGGREAAPPLPAWVRRGLLVLLGAACGISPAFFGYFGMSVWGPIAIGLAALALALLVARPVLPTGLAAVAIAALALFALWSLLSIGWAESADRALTEGDRWILYALYLLVVVLLLEDRRDGAAFVAAVGAGVLCIAGYDLTKMLGGEGRSLFGGSRLLEPLGYINGMGGFFLLGFWPLVAVAERARQAAVAGLAAGGATLLVALVLLTDSRGTAFAFAASALLVLVLMPGRSRRAWLLLVVLAGLAVAWGPLSDVTAVLPHGTFAPAASTIERAARWSLAIAVAVGALWSLATAAVAAARRGRPSRLVDNLPRISAAALWALVAVALVAAAVSVKDPGGRISEQYESFTKLEKVESGVRFTSGGGNRYDYWRIAWHQFTDHPLDGVGAGNFDRTYFLERRTDEDVRQAHSIELQTLGETGLIGGLILLAFFVAAFAGLWRRSREARRGRRGAAPGLTIAATGMFVVWLAQTSVDWLHLIPGLTGAALGAGAILLLPAETDGEARRFRPLPLLGIALAIPLAAAAIVLIGRPTLAEHLRSEAQSQIETEPRRAVATAVESLSLNPESVQGYYLKAAALAKLGLYRPARTTLLEAIRREPHNYVSWALLGDLATRRGAIGDAIVAYRHASLLNPRDRELSLLGSQRRQVQRLHRNPSSVAALPEAGG